jgi:hypothetical protein
MTLISGAIAKAIERHMIENIGSRPRRFDLSPYFWEKFSAEISRYNPYYLATQEENLNFLEIKFMGVMCVEKKDVGDVQMVTVGNDTVRVLA